MSGSVELTALDAAGATAENEALSRVLFDCVEGGASVSFMWPFDMAQARRFWGGVATAVGEGRAWLYVARVDGVIGGTVQLWTDGPCNQKHRGDVRKLLVHRSMRRMGLANRLMAHLEGEATRAGLTLLTLDTQAESPAERLYRGRDWTCIGVIPGFALWPDGRPCDTSFLYKQLTA